MRIKVPYYKEVEVNTLTIVLMAVMVVITLVNSYFFIFLIEDETELVHTDVKYREIYGTGSMLPVFDKSIYPHLTTSSIEITNDMPLYLNKVYIYEYEMNNETRLIMHRLLQVCPASNETKYIFKGDHNVYADDLISYDQIIEEVIGVDFN